MLLRHETREFPDFETEISGFPDLEIGISGSVRIRGDPEIPHFGPLFRPLVEGIFMVCMVSSMSHVYCHHGRQHALNTVSDRVISDPQILATPKNTIFDLFFTKKGKIGVLGSPK
jgi:hypothetical protein